MKLFKRDDITIITSDNVEVPEISQQERADFRAGYRQGFPLVGEKLPVPPTQPSAAYQRGLQWGKRDYVPGVKYEE